MIDVYDRAGYHDEMAEALERLSAHLEAIVRGDEGAAKVARFGPDAHRLALSSLAGSCSGELRPREARGAHAWGRHLETIVRGIPGEQVDEGDGHGEDRSAPVPAVPLTA